MPAIREYTRITSTSRTCIDNIVINSISDYSANVITSGIADHKAQILELNLKLDNISNNYQTIYRERFLQRT